MPERSEAQAKKKNFGLRGLGCTAAAHVSVPSTIRTAADWEPNNNNNNKNINSKNSNKSSSSRERRVTSSNSSNNNNNKTNRNSKKGNNNNNNNNNSNGTGEVCCGPGIGGLSTDAASVDCVVRRERGRLKLHSPSNLISNSFVHHRDTELQRPFCSTRRMVNPELTVFMESEHSLEEAISSRFDVFGGSRYHRHVRHPSPEGFSEIMMLHSNLMMGGRPERFDRYRDLRLDVDHMSYEDLLELGEKIGHVNTGLKEDEIIRCLKQTKILNRMFSLFPSEMESKCSICQEDYEVEDEIGKLECGHFYHIDCVKQWLSRRNTCPICKTAAAPQL